LSYNLLSPKYAKLNNANLNRKLCTQNVSVNAFLSGGLAPGKLVVGFPAFGHTFTLESETETEIGANAIGAGDGGPWTQAPGIMSYNEVQGLLRPGQIKNVPNKVSLLI